MSKQSFNKRKFEETSNSPISRKRGGGWKYSADDKARWPELLNLRDRKLLDRKISYVINEKLIQAIMEPVPVPTPTCFTPNVPGEQETDNAKEIRLFHNSLSAGIYKDALTSKIKERKLIEQDCETYLSIIYDHLVVNSIRDELHDFETTHCSQMTNLEKVNAIFNHLERTHGPHSSIDVLQLCQRLAHDLDPKELGWTIFLRKFNHTTVTTLETLHRTDASTGEIIRGPRPNPAPIPFPILTNDDTIDVPLYKKFLDDTKAATEKILNDFPLGGPPLNFKPSDAELKSHLLRRMKHSPIPQITKVYGDSLEHVLWTWEDIIKKLRVIADDLDDKGLSTVKSTYHNNSSSSQLHHQASYTPSHDNSTIRQVKQSPEKPLCLNCGGPHKSWECPSKVCKFPGCNAGKFDSAEARQAHFVETHRTRHRDQTTNGHGGRGNHYAGRGGGRGQPHRNQSNRSDARVNTTTSSNSTNNNGKKTNVNRTISWSDDLLRNEDIDYDFSTTNYDEITDEVPTPEGTKRFSVRMIRIEEADKEIIDLLSSDDSNDESNRAGTSQQSANVLTDEIPQHSVRTLNNNHPDIPTEHIGAENRYPIINVDQMAPTRRQWFADRDNDSDHPSAMPDIGPQRLEYHHDVSPYTHGGHCDPSCSCGLHECQSSSCILTRHPTFSNYPYTQS